MHGLPRSEPLGRNPAIAFRSARCGADPVQFEEYLATRLPGRNGKRFRYRVGRISTDDLPELVIQPSGESVSL